MGCEGRSNVEAERLMGRRLVTPKVKVAERVARAANSHVRLDAVVGDVVDQGIARWTRTQYSWPRTLCRAG